MGRFGTPTEYRENPGPVYFLDDVTETRGIVFQPDVYAMAKLLAGIGKGIEEPLPMILDVGCGWGDKLAALHATEPHWRYIGLDYGDNLAHCREAHPWGVWIEHDLEGSFALDDLVDVVICSDVVEHLVDPRPLLDSIHEMRDAVVVWSTPERDVQATLEGRARDLGPPRNLCHVREWNGLEFRSLLIAHGFEVQWFGLTRGNDVGDVMGTQIVVARPR